MMFTEKIKTVRTINWFELIDPKYVTMQIVPDTSVRNHRSEEIVRTICDQFELPIDRIVREGLRIKGFRIQERASFEILFIDNTVKFLISVPESVQPLIQRRLSSVWDKATIEVVPYSPVPEKSVLYELVYKRHDIYSLHTDAKDNTPLSSILEAGKLVTDQARIVTYFDPIHQLSWQQQGMEAWKKLRNGVAPRKWTSGGKALFTAITVAVSHTLSEIVTGINGMISDQESIFSKQDKDPEASMFAIHNLTPSTRAKMAKPGIKSYIWVTAENDLVAKTLANAFTDLSDDNELQPRKINSKKRRDEVFRTINTKKPPRIKINYNVLSSAEASKLVQLPGRELQDMYPEVERVGDLQVQIKDGFTKGGMYLGQATFKGVVHDVYKPVDDVDELCLPTVVIGGMGQGKTEGYGANTIVEAVRNGFGALGIDAAKRQLGDQVEKVLPPDKIHRIDLSKVIFGLDWCEAEYDERAKSRLTGTVMSFFNTAADEAGGQTERFIRAAVMGMQTGKLSEIMKIFEDDKYLESTIKRMPEGLNKSTLEQYKAEQPGRRRQILSPIYNRLNVILSDPHLAECFDSDNSLDFVKITSEKKAVIIDVPDDSFDSETINIIVNLITSKLDLAMRLRGKVGGREKEFPFHIVLDEPHKYTKSARIWEAALVESRKWRYAYHFMFHYWEQVPSGVQKAIRSALPHYHLYPSSKSTFTSLKEEILPFELEDALKLKRWHAINIIRTGGENSKPFIASMALPPSKRNITFS